jgi:type I restriction enzyme M protein
MAAIEEENRALRGVLPRTYQSLTNATLVSLLRSVNAILGDIEGDAFGKVYEYFLGKFAVAEGDAWVTYCSGRTCCATATKWL